MHEKERKGAVIVTALGSLTTVAALTAPSSLAPQFSEGGVGIIVLGLVLLICALRRRTAAVGTQDRC